MWKRGVNKTVLDSFPHASDLQVDSKKLYKVSHRVNQNEACGLTNSTVSLMTQRIPSREIVGIDSTPNTPPCLELNRGPPPPSGDTPTLQSTFV